MGNWLTTNAYRSLGSSLGQTDRSSRSNGGVEQQVANVAHRTLSEYTDSKNDSVFKSAIGIQAVVAPPNAILSKIGGLAKSAFFVLTPSIDEPKKDREILLSESMLSSDWEARSLLPIDYAVPFEGPSGLTLERPAEYIEQKKPGHSFEKRHLYRAIDTGNTAASAISFAFSFVTTTLKWATHAISPIATAIPFIGLFNGLANGFALGKGIERLHFYSKLKAELLAGRYDIANRNFGKYSASLLAKYPKLAEREISPSRLLKFLESEVRRKQVKYAFYMTSKILGVGAAVVSFLGGLAAFAIPIFAFPALFIGLPLAILSFGIGIAGNQLAKFMRDPLLKEA